MQLTDYHKKIVEYYTVTENAYKDSWDLNNSLAIHYGYWDEKVSTFAQSLKRMNEIMCESASISHNDNVLDAGCGVGGGSIFIAATTGAKVTGITLSERQVQQAKLNARNKGLDSLVEFRIGNYCSTTYPDEHFDVVWGCESICYADNKEQFIKEAFRLLKPGGRLVVVDGFVKDFENNNSDVIRKWLDGWQVNYLESPGRFKEFMKNAGFADIAYRDISKYVSHSSRRLNRFYYLAHIYLLWKTITLSNRFTEMQRMNIDACRYQWLGLKRGLWEYGMIIGRK